MSTISKKLILRRLERGLKRIEPDNAWCRGAMFYCRRLGKVLNTSRHADAFCAIGAISDNASDYSNKIEQECAAELRKHLPDGKTNVTHYNDFFATKKDIENLFKKTIARVRREIEEESHA